MINLFKKHSKNNSNNSQINNNTCFMAFKAFATNETPVVKNYIGFTKCIVKAVNLTLEERNKLLNIDSEKIPEYTGVDDKGVKYARVTFYVQPLDADDQLIDKLVEATFFVKDTYRYNNNKSKVQVIDKYGYSTWATEEDIKNHTKLFSQSGQPLRISTTYRPAYVGEIALVEFIKTYLGITNQHEYMTYTENTGWIVNKKELPENCEVEIDVQSLLKGNFTDIKTIPNLMPENKIKMAFGIKTADNGNIYQTVYVDKVATVGSTGKDVFKDINSRKENGGLSNQVFKQCPIEEYVVTPTDLTQSQNQSVPSAMPFAAPTADENPWFKA